MFQVLKQAVFLQPLAYRWDLWQIRTPTRCALEAPYAPLRKSLKTEQNASPVPNLSSRRCSNSTESRLTSAADRFFGVSLPAFLPGAGDYER
jgi:hypothetical protein